MCTNSVDQCKLSLVTKNQELLYKVALYIKQYRGMAPKVLIKTHGSVSCGPRSQFATPRIAILTGRTHDNTIMKQDISCCGDAVYC